MQFNDNFSDDEVEPVSITSNYIKIGVDSM